MYRPESKCVLYAGQTKRESKIWHNLGGNTILFFNINNEYMKNKQINQVCFRCCLSMPNLTMITAMII